MVKRILAGFLSAFMLLALAVPAYAEDTGSPGSVLSGPEDQQEALLAPKLKQLKAFVASVDATTKKMTIRSGKGSGKVVNVDGAVVVILDGETARVGVLTDLAAGDKVEMWVLKKKSETGEYKAVLVLKGKQPQRAVENGEKNKGKWKGKGKKKGHPFLTPPAGNGTGGLGTSSGAG